MDTYKCLNESCGHIFEGDLSTTVCPLCGSPVKKTGHGFPWKKIMIAAAVLGVFGCVIAWFMKEPKIEPTLVESSNGVFVKASGINKNNCRDFIIEIEFEGNTLDRFLSFNGDRSGTFSYEDMEVGTYYFRIIRKDHKNFNNKWIGNNFYTKDPEPEAPIITAEGRAKDRDLQVWKQVVITLVNQETQKDVVYTLNGTTQSSNIFSNVAPGTYIITARNGANLEGTYTLVLPNIKPLQARLTYREMNQILEGVHKKEINLGEARRQFSEIGDIDLKTAVDGFGKLYALLNYTRQDGAPQYEVVSCEYDDENQIVSGTLELKRR